MFVNHTMVGFALGAGGARLANCSHHRALTIGASTGVHAANRDVDTTRMKSIEPNGSKDTTSPALLAKSTYVLEDMNG